MLKKITFLILIIFLFLISVNFVLADNYLPGPQPIQPPDIKIKIPGMDNLGEIKPAMCTYDETKTCYQIPWIANYIGGVYKFGVSALALLSVIVIAWGGIVWLTAGGSATQVSKAKDWILGGITGLILGLSSYVLLVTINPDFINLKPLEIMWVKPIPLEQIESEYAARGCLTEAEKNSSFTAQITGYCGPQSSSYSNRQDFLCAVGLNCTCPNGRSSSKKCNSKNFCWTCCNDFDDKNTPYCNATKSGGKPAEGQVAADWSCFPKSSQVCIGGTTYRVTDVGSAIKGRRFDVWQNSCAAAYDITGTYQTKVGACQ